MLRALHDRLRRVATWRVLALVLIAFLLCQLGFVFLRWQYGLPSDVPDLSVGYGPEELRDRFDRWGGDRRRVYAVTAGTLDVAVPILYATLFAGCTVRLLGDRGSPLVIVPALSAGLADLAENATLAFLAWRFDGRESPLVWAATTFTLAKFLAAAVATGILLLVGLVAFRRWRSR